jgi:hypothetical protein
MECAGEMRGGSDGDRDGVRARVVISHGHDTVACTVQ